MSITTTAATGENNKSPTDETKTSRKRFQIGKLRFPVFAVSVITIRLIAFSPDGDFYSNNCYLRMSRSTRYPQFSDSNR